MDRQNWVSQQSTPLRFVTTFIFLVAAHARILQSDMTYTLRSDVVGFLGPCTLCLYYVASSLIGGSSVHKVSERTGVLPFSFSFPVHSLSSTEYVAPSSSHNKKLECMYVRDYSMNNSWHIPKLSS